MTHKQKQLWFGMTGAIALTLILLLLSPLGSFLRGDIFGTSTVSQERGLYEGYTTMSGSSLVLKAGTGVVMENDGIIYNAGLTYVDIYTVTGSGNLLSNSVSGVVTYDPLLLHATVANILPEPGISVDTFVSDVLLLGGKESGTLRFQLNSTNVFTKNRQKVGRIGLQVLSNKITTDVTLKTLRMLSSPTLNPQGSYLLTDTGTTNNLAVRPLTLSISGLTIVTETINSTGSGTVIKVTQTNPDGSQYIKETWQTTDPTGKIIQHILETFKDPNGVITKTIETTIFPDGSKIVIVTTFPDGIKVETHYAPDGHITEIIKTYPDGTVEHWWYDALGREIRYENHAPADATVYIRTQTYDPNGITKEEWWYENGKLIKHQITYPDGSTLVETYTYNPDGSYLVHSVFTDKNGGQIIIDSLYDKDKNLVSSKLIKDDVTLSDAKQISAGNGEITITIPAKATLKQVTPTLAAVSALNNPAPAGQSFATGLYNFTLPNQNDNTLVKQLFVPAQVNFVFNPAMINVPGKTLSNIIPVVFDPISNTWMAVPSTDITKKDSTGTTFNITRAGIYAVLIQFTDSPTVYIPTSGGSAGGSYGGSGGNYPPAVFTAFVGAGGDGKTKPKPPVVAANTCTNPAQAFTDIRGHWGERYIEEARLKCIIGGKKPGKFEPNSLITRAELTKIVVGAFKKQLLTDLKTKPFMDVQLKDWYASVVATAKAENMISGYKDTTFKPNVSINRAEALKIIIEASKASLPQSISASIFADVKSRDWFAKYVEYAYKNSIVSGYKEKNISLFKPANNITRAEAVKIIMEAIK